MDYQFLLILSGTHEYDTESFNPCYSGLSILIIAHEAPEETIFCFNPCYSGLSILISFPDTLSHPYQLSFNPCYSGLSILICHSISIVDTIFHVSILVIVDYQFL